MNHQAQTPRCQRPGPRGRLSNDGKTLKVDFQNALNTMNVALSWVHVRSVHLHCDPQGSRPGRRCNPSNAVQTLVLQLNSSSKQVNRVVNQSAALSVGRRD
jgi:hypothetical protein